MSRRPTNQAGFTAVELVVSMAVLGLLFAAFALVVSSAFRHGGEIEESSVLQTEARAAVERFAAELRQAYSGDEETSTFPIEQIGGNWITFLSPDRRQPFHLRRIRYELVSGRLERQSATSTDTDGWPWQIGALGGTEQLVGSVRNTPILSYFDADGNPLAATSATRDSVRTVRLTLVVSTNTQPARSTTYETGVTLRADL